MYGAAGLCEHVITSFLKHCTVDYDAGFKQGAHVSDRCNGGRRIKKSKVARCRAQAFNPRSLHGYELEASLIYVVSSGQPRLQVRSCFKNKTNRAQEKDQRPDLDQGHVCAQKKSPEILVQGDSLPLLALIPFLALREHVPSTVLVQVAGTSNLVLWPKTHARCVIYSVIKHIPRVSTG